MARQCLVASIMHQSEAESSASVEGGPWQSRIPILSTNMVLKDARCERLEEIVIDGDLKKFF